MFGHFVGCHKIRLEICLWWVFSYIKALFICDFSAMLSWGASCDFFSGSAGQYVCDVRHLPRASWVEGNRHSRTQWCSYFSRRSVIQIGWIFKLEAFDIALTRIQNHVYVMMTEWPAGLCQNCNFGFFDQRGEVFQTVLDVNPLQVLQFHTSLLVWWPSPYVRVMGASERENCKLYFSQ